MIEIILQFGGEIVLVKIKGNSIQFGNTGYGAILSSIEGLRLNKAGVEKEFPDLKGNDLWREEAIKRFKEKIKSLKTERAIARYIIDDLKKVGYVPKRMQVAGGRTKIL